MGMESHNITYHKRESTIGSNSTLVEAASLWPPLSLHKNHGRCELQAQGVGKKEARGV